MDRRAFLKLLGVGAATAVASEAVAERPGSYHDSFDTWEAEAECAAYRNLRTGEVRSYAEMQAHYERVQQHIRDCSGINSVARGAVAAPDCTISVKMAPAPAWADRDGELQRIMTQKLANHRAAFEAAMSADWDRLPTPIQEMLDGIARSVALEVPSKSGSMAALFHAMATEHRHVDHERKRIVFGKS